MSPPRVPKFVFSETLRKGIIVRNDMLLKYRAFLCVFMSFTFRNIYGTIHERKKNTRFFA